jgi:hypothetical protein
MKRFRTLKDDTTGGIAAYVLIMFGMAFMLYLFGFQTMYGTYMSSANVTSGGTNMQLSNPLMNQGLGIIQLLLTPMGAMLGLAGAGTLVGSFLLFRFLGAQTVFFQYVIPAVILIALNLFIFPINDMANELNPFGLVTSTGLIAFFNIFYILAVVDFIRGPTG